MNGTIIAGLIAAVASVIVAYLAYKGGLRTAVASKDASLQTSQVDAQQSALEAWQGLLVPYRDEVAQLREELAAERRDRALKEELDAKNRADEKQTIAEQIKKLTERVDRQADEIKHWKRLAKVIARWASTLRDEVLRLGGTIPSTPDELLLIQSLDAADDTSL